MDLDLKVVSKEINEILWRNHKTLSTAESCTSGRVASVITAVPGASQYFKGGVVSYANEVKINLLGVDAQVIEEQTPVCEEVARQMVKGALRRGERQKRRARRHHLDRSGQQPAH